MKNITIEKYLHLILFEMMMMDEEILHRVYPILYLL
jgi:hypothetical protein